MIRIRAYKEENAGAHSGGEAYLWSTEERSEYSL
jgi:hypothetical protein